MVILFFFIWISLPCKSWSSWQNVNLKCGSVDTVRKVEFDRQVSLAMISLVCSVIRSLICSRFFVGWEWPLTCSGWQFIPDDIVTLLNFEALFDGCQYGLKDHFGQFLKKSWKVLTNSIFVHRLLNKRCKYQRRHGQVRGLDAVRSGLYTVELVRTIMEAIVCHCDFNRFAVNATDLLSDFEPKDQVGGEFSVNAADDAAAADFDCC